MGKIIVPAFLRLLREKPQHEVLQVGDHAEISIIRGRRVEDVIKIGPNMVHAMITHPDGSIDDLGQSHNLITDGGIDWLAYAMGGRAGFGVISSIATASSATSLTGTGTPFTASAHIGQIVIAENGTDAPVWGTIVSNTTSVLTVDAWRYGDGSAGATPGATANFQILPGQAPARFMALTENASAASAGNTALTGEITTNGLERALATFAHTASTATFTISKAFSATGSFPAVHRMGIFFHSTPSTGPMLIETVLNADANLLSGDTLTVTDTVTLS